MKTNLKQTIDQVLIHKVTGNLGRVDMQVTEALLKHLRDKETEHLQNKIVIKKIRGMK